MVIEDSTFSASDCSTTWIAVSHDHTDTSNTEVTDISITSSILTGSFNLFDIDGTLNGDISIRNSDITETQCAEECDEGKHNIGITDGSCVYCDEDALNDIIKVKWSLLFH